MRSPCSWVSYCGCCSGRPKAEPAVKGLELYGELCSRMLAKAHARSGDRIAIAGFLDAGKALDQAMERDAVAYAAQAEQNHQLFLNTIREGRLEASLLSKAGSLNLDQC